MKISKKYSLLVVLLLLTIIALVGLLILRQQQIIQQLALAPPKAQPSSEKEESIPLEVKLDKITAAEYTPDCRIKVTTTKTVFYLKTEILSAPEFYCVQSPIESVSPSGYFLAYGDQSGGLDSVLKLYSHKHGEAYTLGVFGTSEIFDVQFLPDDKLGLLNGYHGLPAEQYATLYDIPKIILKIPQNLNEYRYIRLSHEDTKQLTLPKPTKDFDHFSLTADSLQILGKDNEILARFKLRDL